jgi:hypothetical protein
LKKASLHALFLLPVTSFAVDVDLLLTNGQVNVQFATETGLAYSVQYSPDLVGTWSSVTDIAVQSGVTTLETFDVLSGASTQRYYRVFVDELAARSDHFSGSGSAWTYLNSNQLSSSVSGGQLSLRPLACGAANAWTNGGSGIAAVRTLTGDFMVTAVVHVRGTNNAAAAPPANGRIAGLIARFPTGTNVFYAAVGTHANGTNYVFDAISNALSRVSAYGASSPDAELRLCRIGNTISLKARATGAVTWTCSTNYTRNDLPAALEVGAMAHAIECPSDLAAYFDCIEFRRPRDAAECDASGGLYSMPCVATPVSSQLLDGVLGTAPGGSYQDLATVEIRSDVNTNRLREIAFSGIPVARTQNLLSVENLALVGTNGQRYAVQFNVASRWSGTVDNTSLPARWLEVTAPASLAASGTVTYTLRRYASLAAASDAVAATITTQGNLHYVDTGLATFTLNATNPALFEAMAIDLDDDGAGRATVYTNAPGAGPKLVFVNGASNLTLDTTVAGRVRVDTNGFSVLQTGPVKVVVALKGHFSHPSGATLCGWGGTYERFGYTLVATFQRGSRDVALEYHFRNECSDGLSGPWTDDASSVVQASWEFPFGGSAAATPFYAATAGVSNNGAAFTGLTLVEQRKGGGTPWRRRTRVLRDGSTVETNEALSRPFVALAGTSVVATLQMPWMRYREPQALAVSNGVVGIRVISEQLTVGEGKGLWNHALLGLHPAPSGSVTQFLEGVRASGSARLERPLLVRTPLDYFNACRIYPSLGSTNATAVKSNYLAIINQLHDETVLQGGQWDRAKTYGSQLWPDVQYTDPWTVDYDNPFENPAGSAMNYWNASGAELLEFFRTGDPKWVWDFGMPQSWLQMFTAYLNIGDRTQGNHGGLAVSHGPLGAEENWHRGGDSSDDYMYDMGMQLAYAIRPGFALRERFAQAGRTIVTRYNIPKASEGTREQYVSQVDITRQVIQHFEMLANTAEFVPGADGTNAHGSLREVVAELTVDNLRSGSMCEGDATNLTTGCLQPQQFMQNAMMYLFFHRYYRNYGDVSNLLARSLYTAPSNYYRFGTAKLGDGTNMNVAADWAYTLQSQLGAGGSVVTNAFAVDTGDGLVMYGYNKPHSVALMLMAHELNTNVNLKGVGKAAFDNPALMAMLQECMVNNAGWWKGADQMMQGLVFGVGLYDTLP